MTLPDLIDRLQKAEGPSRELDWRIAEQFNIPEEWRVLPMWPPFMKWSKFDKAIPSFTASIDAAIAFKDIVLPGWKPSIGQNVHHGYWHAVLRQVVDGDVLERSATHETSASLALVIAVLRALAEHEEAGR